MPFENEIATGESLLALQKSAALRDFEGIIAVRGDNYKKDPPPLMNVPQTIGYRSALSLSTAQTSLTKFGTASPARKPASLCFQLFL